MNNITELPAYVFKNFPYLEELWVHAPFFLLLMMYLLCTMLTWGPGFMICTWIFEFVLQNTQYRCTTCPSSQLEKISAALREVTNPSPLNKGSYKRCSEAQLKWWGETTCIEATVMWHPVWIFAFKGLSGWQQHIYALGLCWVAYT